MDVGLGPADKTGEPAVRSGRQDRCPYTRTSKLDVIG